MEETIEERGDEEQVDNMSSDEDTIRGKICNLTVKSCELHTKCRILLMVLRFPQVSMPLLLIRILITLLIVVLSIRMEIQQIKCHRPNRWEK